jgi:type 1 glutamine amidotransferase
MPSALPAPVLALSALLFAGAAAAAADSEAKILFFTKSSGFVHPAVKPGKDGGPGTAEVALSALGKSDHFTLTTTKDGGVFTAEKLKEFDAFIFYTTGDLTTPGTDKEPPMSAEGKQAFLDAIKAGKGYVGLHSAADTFHSASGPHSKKIDAVVDPYLAMLGAEFIEHGDQQAPKIIVADPAFPGLADIKDGFEMKEEWYTFKQFQKDLHVLLVLDPAGLKGVPYQRGPYPVSWLHPYGKGHVFYTAMGHRDDVLQSPIFSKLVTAGINYALGRITVDETPNLEKVAPKYAEIGH